MLYFVQICYAFRFACLFFGFPLFYMFFEQLQFHRCPRFLFHLGGLFLIWYVIRPAFNVRPRLVQFRSVYCFAITKCTNANYYYVNTNGEEAQGKPPGLFALLLTFAFVLHRLCGLFLIWYVLNMLFALLLTFALVLYGLCGLFLIWYLVRPAFNVCPFFVGLCGLFVIWYVIRPAFNVLPAIYIVFAGYFLFDMLFALLFTFPLVLYGLCEQFLIWFAVRPAFNVCPLLRDIFILVFYLPCF